MILPRIFVVVGDPGRDCGTSEPIAYTFDEDEARTFCDARNAEPSPTYYYRYEEVPHAANLERKS